MNLVFRTSIALVLIMVIMQAGCMPVATSPGTYKGDQLHFGQEQTDFWVIAANIETGTVNNIYQNTTIGYPGFSKLDDRILFTYETKFVKQ